MSYFPQVPLGVKVELLINGAWTDITAFVYVRDPITITGGSVSWGDTPQPASATMTLNNRDGRFSPNYVNGPFWPFLQRNVRLRISVSAVSSTGNTYSGYRFWGSVPSWPPLSDLSGRDVFVKITASGPLRQVNMGGGKGSALTRYYGALTGAYAPVAYWPAEEDPDSSILGAGIDGGTNMTVTSGKPTFKAISDFNGSAPVAIVNGSVWDGLTGSVSYSGDDLFTVPGTYTWVSPVTAVDARCQGGGGGGFSASPTAGAGGGGGEEAEEAALAVTVGKAYTVTVGAGGGAGVNGGVTTFPGDSVTVTAHGGTGATGTSGPAGGTGSANTAHHDGGAGAGGTSGGSQTVVTLTASGSWTAPAGVTAVQVEGWGSGAGGAGGGLAGGANSGGYGGGGGAYAKLNSYTVIPGHSYSFQVGPFANGGSPNNLGSDGTDTWWVGTSVLLAKAGKAATGPVGQGGAAASCVGDVKNSGGNGGSATSTGGSGAGGAGGSTGAGSAGTSVTGTTGGAGGAGNDGGGTGGAGGNGNAAGSQGGAPGGGGGGGGGGASAGSGALGRRGQIVLTYTPSLATGGGGGGSGGTAAAGNAATTATGATAVAGGGPGGNGGVTTSPGLAPVTGPGGGGGGSGGGTAGSGFAGQVELVYTPPSAPANNVMRHIMLVPAHGGNNNAVLLRWKTGGTIAQLDVIYQAGGKILLKGYSSAPALLFTSSALTVGDGQTVMVSAELVNSGSSVAYTLTAVIPGAAAVIGTITGTQATASIGNVTECLVAPNGDVTKTAVGHISLQYALIPLVNVSRALNGHVSEMTVDRLIRLCSESAMGAVIKYAEDHDHWGFEDGATASFTAVNGAVTNSTAWASDGTHSLLLTANGGGNPSATAPSGTSGEPVQAGDIVSVSAELYAPVQLSNGYLGIKWYQASGAACAHAEDDTADTVIPVTAAGTTLTVSATAPATAAFLAVTFGDHHADANLTLLYCDNIRVSPQMGAQAHKQLATLLKEIHTLEAGLLHEAKTLFGLAHGTRIKLITQSAAVTLDYSAGQLSGVPAPVPDDKLIKNDITVKNYKGSSVQVSLNSGAMSVQQPPAGVTRYKKQITAVANADGQLLALANHLLTIGTDTSERYPVISVALHRSEVAALMSAIAAVEVSDMVALTGLPFWYPSATTNQLVIGYTETLGNSDGMYTWDIDFNCSPASPYLLSAASPRRW